MKFKIALIWMCILSVTCSVIFFPVLISRSIRKHLTEKKTAWEYTEKSKQRLTDVEFARLFSCNYFETMLDSYHQINAADFDRSSAKALLTDIMPNDQDFLAEICNIMDTGDPVDFNANTVFITRDGYPEALRLINAAYEKDGRFISLYYEEKTMTLISLNYSFAPSSLNDKDSENCHVIFPTAALVQYYRYWLQLPPNLVYMDYGDNFFSSEIVPAELTEKIIGSYETDQ